MLTISGPLAVRLARTAVPLEYAVFGVRRSYRNILQLGSPNAVIQISSQPSHNYHICSSSLLNGSKRGPGERDWASKQICGLHRGQHKLAEQRPGNHKEIDSVSVPATKIMTSSTSVADSSPSPSSSKIVLPPKPQKKVRNFVFAKFFGFVQGYHKILEKNFPGAMNVYRVFVVGFKDFSKELGEYVMVTKKALLASNGVRDLNSQELDVYYRMPKEMFKVGPTLLISALPFMNYIMFPIAYYFPKRLLSSHFWSIQQKSQFAIEYQKQRLYNNRPVFRYLQAHVSLIRDKKIQAKCREILDKLGSGSHPTVREIMDIKPLFESDPFSLKAIYGPHVKGLCRLHGIHTLYLKRRRLFDRAEMLHVMDTAMIKDGIFNLKSEELKGACYIRGLNAANSSQKDMVEYLQQWSSISSSVSPHSYSLLLHLPILLAYNNANNWALL